LSGPANAGKLDEIGNGESEALFMSDVVSNPSGQPAAPGGLFNTPPFPRAKAPRKNDIMSQRSRWYQRAWRFVRAVWLWVLIVGLLIWMAIDPVVLNLVFTVSAWVLERASILAFGILQFVAIFWFMSRSKTVIVLPEDPKVTNFDDYWGQPTLLRLVKQWISLLSDRAKFVEMGGNYINGILLYGPPGTGKTMLAKAMAGEAGIPFMSVEGSGFRGMFWGVDVLKMMAFCGKAKKLAREYGACIAYIDEIDAVGMSRGGVMGGGGQGGMQGMGMGGMMGGGSGSLTRLLYEMDGIDEKSRTDRMRDRIRGLLGLPAQKRNWHVLYMGSTNRPDVLDPALMRPGRFDQKIEVGTPDKSGRREVINGYLRKVPLLKTRPTPPRPKSPAPSPRTRCASPCSTAAPPSRSAISTRPSRSRPLESSIRSRSGTKSKSSWSPIMKLAMRYCSTIWCPSSASCV